MLFLLVAIVMATSKAYRVPCGRSSLVPLRSLSRRPAAAAAPVESGHSHSHSHANIVEVLPGYLRWLREHLGDAMQPKEGASTAEFRLADGVTWLGFGVNVALTGVKFYAGVVSHSAAMIADAVHSLSDLLSDVVTLISMRLARLPPDDDHGYGHERFETVGAMFVGAMLLAAAWGLGETALGSLRESLPMASFFPTAVVPLPDLTAVGSHFAAAHALPVAQGTSWLAICQGNLALWAALLSIFSKEALYRGTMVVAKKLKSPALRANAMHHRSDAMSSVIALVGISATAIGGPGFAFADGLAAGVVALMLGAMGLRISVEALAELTDTVDEADLRAVRESVQKVEGVKSVARSRGRLVGGALVVDVDVVSHRDDISASASARLAERARLAILSSKAIDKELKQAFIRVVPDKKVCPVVATLPSQDEIIAQINDALTNAKFTTPFVLHDAQVHYDGLQPVVDLFLDPTDKSATVKHLKDSASAVRHHLTDVVQNDLVFNRVFWLADGPGIQPITSKTGSEQAPPREVGPFAGL